MLPLFQFKIFILNKDLALEFTFRKRIPKINFTHNI